MADTSFVLFSLSPVQNFIKAARTVRDLWSGSYLLSYLTFRAMEAVAKQSELGVKAIVFPDVAQLPLWKWEAAGRPKPAPRDVLDPCIPNRFLAEVSGDERHAHDLTDAAEGACRAAWKEIAEAVREFLFRTHGHPSFAKDNERKSIWYQQIDTFFEVYTAVLPAADADRIKALLGFGTGTEWADRHQVAQKGLAAVKSQRHFPKYAPQINGDVPQKDTLLGTLEHMGPGNRREAGQFWATAAERWHEHGSKVTRREKLCAVSLVKRFAWAHHFAPLFGYEDRRILKFSDTATVAAKKWLKCGEALEPRALKNPSWSGLWLHWSDRRPPDDDPDEDVVPQDVWNAIQAKKQPKAQGKPYAQGRPPAYYAVCMLDGDNLGKILKRADRAKYQKISEALSYFFLKMVQPIVERKERDGEKEPHYGELIYAGGDDAICVLPTETALACVREINAAFAANWQAAFPSDEPATISGGLVVAHYKEDLRFVMEEAHKAEKQSKNAGRDALTVTVCRRSGEHTSAVVPWDFVGTVQGWVGGFLAGASERWPYRLRADLPVVGGDKEMFKLELGRQLDRTEEITRQHFGATNTKRHFGEYRSMLLAPDRQEERRKQDKPPATDEDAITDFITLLQSASFLARGRDA